MTADDLLNAAEALRDAKRLAVSVAETLGGRGTLHPAAQSLVELANEAEVAAGRLLVKARKAELEARNAS